MSIMGFDLGDTVDWLGQRGTITSIHKDPCATVDFGDREGTIGLGNLEKVPKERLIIEKLESCGIVVVDRAGMDGERIATIDMRGAARLLGFANDWMDSK